MRQCMALAALACLMAVGCAAGGSGLMGRGGAGSHVITSRSASRPTIVRDYRKPGPELSVQLAGYCDGCESGCGMCDEGGCGCPVDGCCPNGLRGCNGYACGGDGCGGPCRRLIDGVAGGFCGPCGPGGYGVCPHAGGYPENPSFNQGPPVGQAA